jgi:hypothetical protein
MKLLFFLIAGGLVCYIILLIFTNRYTDPPSGTKYTYPDDPDDEFSPEQLDLDKTLKICNLRSKLKKIEKEKL